MLDSFRPDSTMAIVGVVLLPILIWFFRKRQTRNTLIYGGLFLLLFSRGILELFGVPNTALRLLAESVVFIDFFTLLVFRGRKFRHLPGILAMSLFLVAAVVSVAAAKLNFIQLIFFLRDYGILFLFFYNVLNTRFSVRERGLINILLVQLFAAQIFASCLKYLIVGIAEPYVGTMAVLGGSLTTLIALVGGVFCISNYLVFKNSKYLFWTLGFVVFSIIGYKRSTVVYFPFLFILLTYLNQYISGTIKFSFIRQLIVLLAVSVGAIYLSVRLMPSLNKERVVWGSFDIEYALDYSSRYVTTGVSSSQSEGRFGAIGITFERLISEEPIQIGFGYGAGHLVKSQFNKELQSAGSQTELTQRLYGVGYGARTGFLQVLLQVGFIGLTSYLLVFFAFFKYIRKRMIYNLRVLGSKADYMAFWGLWVVFLLDFFTYSATIVQLSAVSLVVFWFLGSYVQGVRTLSA